MTHPLGRAPKELSIHAPIVKMWLILIQKSGISKKDGDAPPLLI